MENLLSEAFSSELIFSAGSDNAIRTRDQVQVVYMESHVMDRSNGLLAKSNLERSKN